MATATISKPKATGPYEGAVVRKARKPGKCANAGVAERTGRVPECLRMIAAGDYYAEGDVQYDIAGGFGHERLCAGCAGIGA